MSVTTRSTSRPLNAERVIVLNAGLGRDSTAILCAIVSGGMHVEGLGLVQPRDLDAVVFSDTGCEWYHTYELVPTIQRMCDEAGVRFVELHKGGPYHYRGSVMDDYKSRQTVASLGKGDCSENHKILPIRRWIQGQSYRRFGYTNRRWSYLVRQGKAVPHITMIGIADDEKSRVKQQGVLYAKELYPLIDNGLTKDGTAPLLESCGLGRVRKSGCFICPYQPISWYWALRRINPLLWKHVVEYEATSLDRNPNMNVTGYRRKKEVLRLDDVVDTWRAKNPDAEVGPVLDKSYTRCDEAVRRTREVVDQCEYVQLELL